MSAVKSDIVAPVTARILARLSVDGHLGLPSALHLLLLLKEVGSSPACLARPEGEYPKLLASLSIPRQISSCENMISSFFLLLLGT